MKRTEDLQVNGLKFVQDDELFLFGTDGVELANFAAPKKGSNVCDLCAGTGIISVLLSGKFGCRVTAVEIQPECCELLRLNAEINNLDITVVNAPLQQYNGHFDAVVCNPPYIKNGGGQARKTVAQSIACFETKVTFAEVAQAAARLLSSGGKFYIVHHITRLAEVISTLKQNLLEPKVLQILRPSANKPPHIFMLQCIRDGKEGITVLPERCV